MKSLILGLVAAVSLVPAAQAAIIHNEAIDGDLSSNNLAPTVLEVNRGSNQIIGSVTPNPNIDRDFFTITIADNQLLTAIILENYDTTEDQSFFAVELGTQISSIISAATFLGTANIGLPAVAPEGSDVLDNLGQALLGGSGFSGPLGPGTYTFWFQETVAPVAYTFNLQVASTPEPSSLLGAGVVLGLSALLKKKKSA
ncbi:MAG: PEP-CTERM sorting domain-containing protein [Chloroflexaceae bacterium]|nr:PEP-CTERM sorting domain-containing protein [Chloroflexaceae bacterium]